MVSFKVIHVWNIAIVPHSPLRSVDKLMAIFKKLWNLIETNKASKMEEKMTGCQYEILTGKKLTRVSWFRLFQSCASGPLNGSGLQLFIRLAACPKVAPQAR